MLARVPGSQIIIYNVLYSAVEKLPVQREYYMSGMVTGEKYTKSICVRSDCYYRPRPRPLSNDESSEGHHAMAVPTKTDILVCQQVYTAASLAYK